VIEGAAQYIATRLPRRSRTRQSAEDFRFRRRSRGAHHQAEDRQVAPRQVGQAVAGFAQWNRNWTRKLTRAPGESNGITVPRIGPQCTASRQVDVGVGGLGARSSTCTRILKQAGQAILGPGSRWPPEDAAREPTHPPAPRGRGKPTSDPAVTGEPHAYDLRPSGKRVPSTMVSRSSRVAGGNVLWIVLFN